MTPENELASVFMTSIILVILEVGSSGNWTSSVLLCSICSFISVLILRAVCGKKTHAVSEVQTVSVVLAHPP